MGVITKGYIPDNGKPLRFPTHDKPKSKNGWAILYPEGKAGFVGNWATGESQFWKAENTSYTPTQIQNFKRSADTALELQYARAAKLANRIWDRAALQGGSEYFTRKQISPHGVRFQNNKIIIPIYDQNNKIISLQFIAPDGSKLFLRGSRTKGGHYKIPGSNKIIICEGYATALSIHAATGYTVIAAFSASNIPNVCKYISGDITIACDNDKNQVSIKYAKQTKKPYTHPKPVGCDFNDLACNGENIAGYFMPSIEAYSFGDYWSDPEPVPDDLIAPRVLTPSGLLVFGGAPKVGKSDFLIGMLAHMAAGLPFMGMTPPRPLKVFYIQAEIGYHYLKERIKALDIQQQYIPLVAKNLVITPQIRMVLDANGVERAVNTIKQHFPHGADIIAIDPLRNVFDGESENDNAQMMTFLQTRIEDIRHQTNPEAGVILAHHTKKITGDALIADPFQGLSGASSLRGYYTTGMIMYRPEETMSERVITYELRNGARVPDKCVDKQDGRWVELDHESSRLVNKHYGAKLDAERVRKRDVILDIIASEAANGNLYETRQFAEKFEGLEGLGAASSIKDRISVLSTKGYIKFLRTANAHHKSSGKMITEGLKIDDKTILPTHYKSPSTGAIIEERHPDIWIYD